MTIQDFLETYGTRTASMIVRKLAEGKPDAEKREAEVLASALEAALADAYELLGVGEDTE